METLIVLIIIFVAVLSTPLSLKKLIDHANRHKQLELNAKPDEQANAKSEDSSADPSVDSADKIPSDKSNKWDDWDDPWND